MRTPADYKRRILVCVAGLTPQVVTETVYALAMGERRFVPTELHIITSTEGAHRARLELLDARGGKLAMLCRQYELPVPTCGDDLPNGMPTLHVISGRSGEQDDLRDRSGNDAAADTILDVVRRLTADEDAAIHFSIAGGRKTMGFYLGYCASLLARPQDEISHVLVNPPFEGLRDFFFPPRPAEVLYDAQNRPIDTRDARVDLAQVPFIRLRSELPSALLHSSRRFSELVAIVDGMLTAPTMTFRLAREPGDCDIEIAGGLRFPLRPRLFAFYWFMAKMRALHGEEGHTTFEHNDFTEVTRHYLDVYGHVSGWSVHWDRLQRESSDVAGFTASDFKNNIVQLSKELTGLLGGTGSSVYGVHGSGDAGSLEYGLLRVPQGAIFFEGEENLAQRADD